MITVSREEAKALIGQGVHTGLRKVGDTHHAGQAYRAIDEMASEEWDRILDFVLEGLAASGVQLMRVGHG